jgi:hypothetical protein
MISHRADAGNFVRQSRLDRLFSGEGNIEEQPLVRVRTLAPRHDRVSLCNLLGRRRRNTP